MPRRAVLVGSSHTRAEINEDQLNDLLGTNLWTTELHFPGSHGYDVLLVERQFRRANPQWVICYLSEGYFELDSGGPMLPNFFRLPRRGCIRPRRHAATPLGLNSILMIYPA